MNSNAELILNLVLDKDPDWFYAWCEREGGWEELEKRAKELECSNPEQK